jgi:hypothetical protein
MAVGLIAVLAAASSPQAQQRPATAPPPAAQPDRALVNEYCVGCHNDRAKVGSLTLEKLDVDRPGEHAETWEKTVRKLRAGLMPPSGARRPDRGVLDGLASRLEVGIDRAAAGSGHAGPSALHRLNRAEYANVIRELLDLDVDVASLLPADDSSDGFDNIAEALRVSPALMERYLSAALEISRVAVGDPKILPSTITYRIPSDVARNSGYAGPAPGAADGVTFVHNFPVDAEYNIAIGAGGGRGGGGGGGRGGGGGGRGGGGARGGGGGSQTEITVNGELVSQGRGGILIKAGPKAIGVSILKTPAGPDSEVWAPGGGQNTPSSPTLSAISITGPFNAVGSGDTPSRRRIFICQPASATDETPCATTILRNLAGKAYRRPVTDADIQRLLEFFEAGRKPGFEAGIQMALRRLLSSPEFVFRIEQEPGNAAPGAVYRVSDLELASRLSFFLWSSIPDDELLKQATAGRLKDPVVLDAQVRRMLADRRARALVENFAGQWLYLRDLENLKSQASEFNDHLRQDMIKETELLFESIIREDRSVADLLDADYTFVNARLARHYGIPGIYGDQFRRITVTNEERRGLLGHASILTITSLANRTSPIARGKWILETLLGTHAPTPPPVVPSLKEEDGPRVLTSVRQRLEAHRANPACASCHKIMDPIGLSLENFDLIGRWRTTDGPSTIDASAELVDGSRLNGPSTLRKALMTRSDLFVQTVIEKLMTYGTAHTLQYRDMPAVRAIMKQSARDNHEFSSIVTALVKSAPFQMKIKQAPVKTAGRTL